MSDQGIDAAVEKILSDRTYARQVFENPEQALSQFELESGEWRSIAWCLTKDVENSLGDVRGHAIADGRAIPPGEIDFGQVNFSLISRVPVFKAEFDRKALGGTVWD